MQNWADIQNALLQGAGQIRDVFQQQTARTGVHVSVTSNTRAPAVPESIGAGEHGVIGAHGSSGLTLGQMQRLRRAILCSPAHLFSGPQ